MRKRSLWSQHICCTLIRFPTLLRLKGKMRGMFPPAIPLAWLGVPLSDRSRVPMAEMQANESPLAKYMRAAWEASFTLNLLVSLKEVVPARAKAEVWCLDGAQRTFEWFLSPASGPECPFLQCSFPCIKGLTLCAYKQGFFFFSSWFLHLWYSLQRKLIRWQDG